ncbi:hypothetical protein FRB93_000608 [Tulasnella sp. JGI-2019a]|nr:hypothetical protein FRB93_000608 [Tulasnella sp. JGI-2019a]
MPPKRKRAAEESADGTTTVKKRATKAPATSTNRKTRADTSNDSAAPSITTASGSKAPASAKPPKAALKVTLAAPVKEPEYTFERLNRTFELYADPEDPKIMSIEGLQRLFEDAEINMEGVVPLLLAWTCKSEEFGVITLDEWRNLKDLKVDTPRNLRIAMDNLYGSFYSHSSTTLKKKSRKPTPDPEPMASQTSELEPKAAEARLKFKDFYMFCFTLMKKSEARVLEMETATVTWSVVLQEKFPIVTRILEFIQAHPSYKAVNKDLWTMTLEFCYATENRDLMSWDDGESWPSILDEFVAWVKSNRTEDVEMS